TPTANGCIGDPQTFTITIPREITTTTPPSQQLCSGERTQLVSFTASEAGAVFKWSASPIGVTGFSTLNGIGSIPVQTLYATGASTGKMIYKVTATINGCEGPPADYQIDVFPAPTTAITYSDANKRYSSSSIPLKGNTPALGMGLWSQISGPNTVSIANASSPETVISGHVPGIYKFRWTITNATCTSSADLNIVVNAPPVAINDYFKGSSKSPITGNLKTNDSDADGSVSSLNVSKVTNPDKGTLTINSNGTFIYVAEPGYVGTQSFIYKITDADGGQDTATVTLRLYLVTTVTLLSDKSQITEGGELHLTPILADPIHEDVIIHIRYSGTASINDFSTNGETPILIKAGETTSLQKVLVTITKDDIKEPEETLISEIDYVSSAYVNIGNGVHFNIQDGYPSTGPGIGKNENADIKPDPLTSPNGDGLGNEEFFIYNISAYPENEVVIFNRWGNEVYRVKNYNNTTNAFRGKSNSGSLINAQEELLDGVYYYLIYTKTAAQGNAVNKGYFIMKRQK
ncbi:MAG: conserved repeat domain protein, partial [Daejeonella sp.]|nr:conserved repeat domain protein [Daejeonella sp.]